MNHPTKNWSSLSEHRLHAYAVAATAAGVGALCLAPTAEAKIVYTPANVKIVRNVGLVRFDLNHDGIADFGLSNLRHVLSSETFAALRVVPSGEANEIWGVYSNQVLCATALPKGRKVGPKGQFQKDPRDGLPMAVSGAYGTYGPWRHVQRAYVGLKFVIKGKTHFGWTRVTLSINARTHAITAILTGYAYETTPGKPIITGATKGSEEQAGSLGSLAAGAVGQ